MKDILNKGHLSTLSHRPTYLANSLLTSEGQPFYKGQNGRSQMSFIRSFHVHAISTHQHVTEDDGDYNYRIRKMIHTMLQ